MSGGGSGVDPTGHHALTITTLSPSTTSQPGPRWADHQSSCLILPPIDHGPVWACKPPGKGLRALDLSIHEQLIGTEELRFVEDVRIESIKHPLLRFTMRDGYQSLTSSARESLMTRC
ncbi:uncharacterized protein LDX57_009633 [Aspergillus melleus]|uniref:uncharacterized protein n=1 Tax=Aspergillus melleus TaxID=138277 RepID=UPI001E8D22E0|nr:uncharacterized protein LDX57_009633 [Aspergillus melleus]KAH8431986.1 hypothetical protein LDX57_009633 [Aspergillus melleus]